MVNKDPVLVDLVNLQTELFNKNATETEKMTILQRIQERQKELKSEGREL